MKDKADPEKARFASNLRRAREALGLTQQQVADLIPVSRVSYGMWENATVPSMPTKPARWQAVERVLGVSEQRLRFEELTAEEFGPDGDRRRRFASIVAAQGDLGKDVTGSPLPPATKALFQWAIGRVSGPRFSAPGTAVDLSHDALLDRELSLRELRELLRAAEADVQHRQPAKRVRRSVIDDRNADEQKG